MSFRVLVIPEDPTHNGYILKPLVQAIVADAGRPNARVDVLSNPRLGGYDHAVRAIREELADRYGFLDLWVFLPDADRATPDQMRNLEDELSRRNVRLLCCPAQPEVEVYACVPYRKDLKFDWDAARRHHALKQAVFQPRLRKHGDHRRPGEGRDRMVEAAIANLPLLFQLCPELAGLRHRIAGLLRAG